MTDQWFTVEELGINQKGCPLSIGQAQPGQYTFCVADKCMAWQWMTDDLKVDEIEEGKEIPKGYAASSEPYKRGKKSFIKIMQLPTHGRCGMVPRFVE